MAQSNKNHDAGRNILVQGTVLAVAEFISRLIGLVYRIPLQRIAGDEGMGYYGYAYDIFSILYILSISGVPLAVMKLISTCRAKHDSLNQRRVVIASLIWTVLVGGVIGGLTVLFASQISRLVFGAQLADNITPSLRVLGSTIFFCCILSAFRGFFQGLGTMIPTAVSNIIEQVFNAVFSVLMAWILVARGPAYAAMGGTLGTCIGALSAVLFLIVIYLMYRPRLMNRVRRDKTSRPIPYSSLMKNITLVMVPVMLGSIVSNINAIVDSSLYSNILAGQGYSADLISTLYGKYTSKFKTIANLPLAMATALGVAMIPDIQTAYVKGDREGVLHNISLTLRFSMIVAIPSTVGLAVLGGPVVQLLFGDTSAVVKNMMTIGSTYVVLYSIQNVTTSALQGIDRMRDPLINSIITLGIHTVFVYVLLKYCDMNVFALVFGTVLLAFIMCILNHYSLKKHIGYKQEIVKTYLIPTAASAVMGICVYIVYRVFLLWLDSNAIACIIAILVGMLIYTAMLLLMHGVTEEEIYKFPKGSAIVRILKAIRLL